VGRPRAGHRPDAVPVPRAHPVSRARRLGDARGGARARHRGIPLLLDPVRLDLLPRPRDRVVARVCLPAAGRPRPRPVDLPGAAVQLSPRPLSRPSLPVGFPVPALLHAGTHLHPPAAMGLFLSALRHRHVQPRDDAVVDRHLPADRVGDGAAARRRHAPAAPAVPLDRREGAPLRGLPRQPGERVRPGARLAEPRVPLEPVCMASLLQQPRLPVAAGAPVPAPHP